MTKKILILIPLVLGLSLSAYAKKSKKKSKKSKTSMSKSWERPYGLAGCGLGSIVMGKEGNQVLAATTNNIHGLETQLFGISLGTSNCVESEDGKMAKKIDVFVHTNKVSLASDMARGEGENIATLGHLLGCSNTERLGTTMKSNFTKIYTSERVKSFQVTDNILNTILDDKKLASSCKNLNLG